MLTGLDQLSIDLSQFLKERNPFLKKLEIQFI